jgi:hypothetical protein
MIRFGTVIEVNRKLNYAVIRENTPHATHFVVLPSELVKVNIANHSQVCFKRDSDFIANVAQSLKIVRL